MPDQRIPLTSMIDGYTKWAAYAAFEEARKGTLAPGMLADLVILSRDVFSQPPTSATDVQVEATIFDGKVVYRRGSGDAGRTPARNQP